MYLIGLSRAGVRWGYALDQRRVVRVLSDVVVYPVPWARAYLRGVCRWQDMLIPVVELPVLMGESSADGGATLVVVQQGDTLIALAADRVWPSLQRSDIQRALRREGDALCPFLLETRWGLFHFVDLRVLLQQRLADFWR